MTGAQLKRIAMGTMLIDHIGAILIAPFVVIHPSDFNEQLFFSLYWICRLIGRLSLPIFLFLLIEGVTHTTNIKKYGFQLLVFAIVSEIPYDLVIYDNVFYWKDQNIFFTLFLGLIMLVVIRGKPLFYSIGMIVIFGLINEMIIKGDYGLYGIILLGGMYLLRKDVPSRNIFVLIVGLYQYIQGFSIFLINQYNGQRGKQNKYFYYLFYPVHLIILRIITK